MEHVITKYLDPKNDVAFKKIFGTEKNKDILIHFLNDVLGEDITTPIVSVKFLSPIQLPELVGAKQSTVDVLCTDQNGTQIIVEMQVVKNEGFEKRAQYYAAKAYCNQAEPGDDTYVNLKAVIFLAITQFIMFPDKESYKSEHVILDSKTLERDFKDFSFTVIELPKFTHDISELKTIEHRWCYFFKHAQEPENLHRLIETSDQIIKRAAEALDAHYWTKDELRAYEAVEKIMKDYRSALDCAKHEGEAEGMVKGKAEGKAEVVKNLLKRYSVEEVAIMTDLSTDEVIALRNA